MQLMRFIAPLVLITAAAAQGDSPHPASPPSPLDWMHKQAALALSLETPSAAEQTSVTLEERFARMQAERAWESGWSRDIDALSFDQPQPGILWVRGRSYKAAVNARGVSFTPFLGSKATRNWPLRLELEAARLGGRDLLVEDGGIVRHDGDTVAIQRGLLREEFHFALESVEQVFVLEGLPLRGELELTLAIESDLTPAQVGAGLEFDGPEGGIRYGGVTVLDAAGRSIELPSRLELDRISIRVPAAFVQSATPPLVVDPVISVLGVETAAVFAFGPDVAWDQAGDTYLVTWEEAFSASDSDVNSMLVHPIGLGGSNVYIDFTTESWRSPSVAGNADAETFLVVADIAAIDIRGRIRPANGGALGAPLLISPGTSNLKFAPSVGGDAFPVGPTHFLVAWEHVSVLGANHDIHAQLVDGSGGKVGPLIHLDSSPGTYDGFARVSKTNGHPPLSEQAWNVTWGRNPDAALKCDTLVFAQVRWDGAILTPSTPKFLGGGRMSIFDHQPSGPLNGHSGIERMWLALYQLDSGGGPHLMADLRKGLNVWTSVDLGGLFGGTFGTGDYYSPAVDSDGAVLTLGFRRVDPLSFASRAWAASLRVSTLGTPFPVLHVSEAPQPLDALGADSGTVRLSLQHASSSSGPRGLCAFEQGGNLGAAVYEPADGVVGSIECVSQANSSGAPAYLTAVGSKHVADNRLFLEAWDLPPANVGMFIMSKNLGGTPFGQGTLCISPPMYRFAQDIKNSGSHGYVSLQVDVTSPAGAAPFAPGEAWRFQYWTRDGNFVNFTNSTRVSFL